MSMDKIKTESRYTLLEIYRLHGYERAKKKADEFLTQSRKEASKINNVTAGSTLRGELAEVLLEIKLREFVNRNKGTFYTKSLCIDKLQEPGKYTELDLTLYTEQGVFLFECKSYYGKKILTEKCLMTVGGREVNIHGQNKMHMEELHKHIGGFKLTNGRVYELVFFQYSEKELIDKRDDEWKTRVPLVEEGTIDEYLKDVESRDVKLWDIEGLYEKIKELNTTSEEKFSKHMVNMKK